MKTLAVRWRDLPADEREKYVLMAEADKARYFSEMATYDGPMQVLNKRAKKPEDAPKRAMSAFLSFSQMMRPEVRLKYPHLKNMELSSLLAQMWREASEEVKRPHAERESKEREKYHEEMAKWKEDEAVRLEREKHALAEVDTCHKYNIFPSVLKFLTPLLLRYVFQTVRNRGGVMGDFPFGYPPQMFSQLLVNNPRSDEVTNKDTLSAAYWSQLQGQGESSLNNVDKDDGEYDNEDDNFVGDMVTGDTTVTTYPKMLATSSSSSSLTTAYDGSDGSRDLSTLPKKRRSKNKKKSSSSQRNPAALTYEGWQSGFAAIAAASASHSSQAMGNLGVYFNFPWLLQGTQGAMMQQQQLQQQQQQASSSSGFVGLNESSSMANVAGMRDGTMAPSTMGPPFDTHMHMHGNEREPTNESDGNDGSAQPPPQKQQKQYNYQLSNFQAYLLQQQQYQHQQYVQLAQHYQNQYQHQLQQQPQPTPLPKEENAKDEKQAFGSDAMVPTDLLTHGHEDCDITEFFFDRDAGGLSPLFFDVDDGGGGGGAEAVPAAAAADKQLQEAQHQQRMFLWQQWEQQQMQTQSAMVAQQRARQFYRSAPSSSDTLASYASHASAQSAVTSVASYSSAMSSAPSFDFDLVNLNTSGKGEQYLPRPQMVQGSARYDADDPVHHVSPRTEKMEADNNASTSLQSPCAYPPVGYHSDDAKSVTQALRNAYQAAAHGHVTNIADDDVQNGEHGDVDSRKRAFSTVTEENQFSSAINF